MSNTLESFVNQLQENSDADSVKTASGKTILLVKRVEESIKAQVKEPGDGSIFAKAWKLEELKQSLKRLSPVSSGLYEGKLSGAGYDLIMERKDIVPLRKLVGYSEDKQLVESETRRVATIPQEIDKFKTDVVTYKIRKVELDEAIKDFTEYEKEAEEHNLFILEDVTIGPHLSKWSDDLYVVVPKA